MRIRGPDGSGTHLALEAVLASLLGALAPSVRAEVAVTSTSGFTVVEQREVRATAADLNKALATPSAWWDDGHTFSQHASNLSLTPVAGGCLCERWAGGAVEHARVVYVGPGVMRLVGALGPMQPLAVQGVLTFQLVEAGQPGKPNLLQVSYRVGGGEPQDMQRWPAAVDEMMGDTADRLARYLDRRH